ncbi:MAG: HD domain-containing protein, partial [Schleiferiaceae bacterium]
MADGVETNKFKLLNDPIYGFIAIPSERIFDLIEHPSFQRLRRIGQLGLSSLVYPGAYHTRFHHALGAMHLMQRAVAVLQSKGHAISAQEAESVQMAILLHDIGHGPFSHALEHTLVNGVSHEELSKMLMQQLNEEMDGALTEAIAIFNNQHP